MSSVHELDRTAIPPGAGRAFRLLFCLTAMLALGGCSAIEGLLKKLRPRSAADERLPKVTASKGDPPAVRRAIGQLQDVAQRLAGDDLAAFEQVHDALCRAVDVRPDPELAAHPKGRLLRRRFRALDRRYAAKVGGVAVKAYRQRRSRRPLALAAQQALLAGFRACDQAAATPTGLEGDRARLEKAYRVFVEQIARAKRIDPRALRSRGGVRGRSACFDVPFEIARCERRVARARLELEDRPAQRVARPRQYWGCGYEQYVLISEQIAPGRWTRFKLRGVPEHNGYPVDCRWLPRRHRVPRAVARVLRQTFDLGRETKAVMVGAYRIVRRSDPESGHPRLARQARIRLYDRKTRLFENPCGSADDKVVCEASGSRAALAYNRIRHYIRRAAVRRDEQLFHRCRELLREAQDEATAFAELRREMQRRGSWVGGLRFKTRDGRLLSEGELSARIEAYGAKADRLLLDQRCLPPVPQKQAKGRHRASRGGRSG